MKTIAISGAAALSVSLLGIPAYAAGPMMDPGLWEITTKTEMPGMPMAMPAQTMRHCYKAEDVKDPKNTVPADKNCKIDEMNQSGNTVSWKMSCKTESGPMMGQGKITHGGSQYSGSMSMMGNMQGHEIRMNSTYGGKRLGDCK